MAKKAVGTDFTPGQARELQDWISKKRLHIDVTAPEVRKQDQEDIIFKWFGLIGQGVLALALFVGPIVLAVQIGIRLGWW